MKRTMLLLLTLALCLTGCGGSKQLAPSAQTPPETGTLSVEAAGALTDFGLALLRENWGENPLVSPLSALSALGLAANGAAGETRAQMEAVLGLPVEDLNKALAAWTAALPGERRCRGDLANALWLRDDGSFAPEEAFLETAGAWYGGAVYGAPMDEGTCREINAWVKKETHGMIEAILEDIPEEAAVYLVNALALEADWAQVYRKDQVRPGVFTTQAGQEQNAELMYAQESLYLEDGQASGFLKPYQGGRWAFAALLPEKGLSLEDYAASLTGPKLQALLTSPQDQAVDTALPKFQCAWAADLSESLQALGMTAAFRPETAGFSGMGRSDNGPLYISKVLHKTYLSVDERGTRAGAASAVEASSGGAGPVLPAVYLNRPFLYMLVDLDTGLPAFIGAVTSLS